MRQLLALLVLEAVGHYLIEILLQLNLIESETEPIFKNFDWCAWSKLIVLNAKCVQVRLVREI